MASWTRDSANIHIIVSSSEIGPDQRIDRRSGIPPHPPRTQLADWTIPTVRMADGEYVMESKAIAVALEKAYPEPSIRLDSPPLKYVEEAMPLVYRNLRAVIVPRMPRECLSGPTIEWHREVRKQTFGMTLEELEAKHGGEAAWEKAMPVFERLAAILKHDPKGPFCLGDKPSYADFLVVGYLEWFRCLGGGILERVIGIDQAFKHVYDACGPWLKRNDH